MKHPLSVAVDTFVTDCCSRRLKSSTLDWYQRMLNKFCDFMDESGLDSLEQIKPNTLRLYFLQLQEEGWKDSTQNACGRALWVFLNFCVREEWIEQSPFKRVRLPRVDQKIRPTRRPAHGSAIKPIAGTMPYTHLGAS